MIIMQDTREKAGKKDHILDYFAAHGIDVVHSKVYVGDYTLPTDQSICIDTKQDMLELFGNLTQDHVRFRNECIRAQEADIQLIVLTEEMPPDGKIELWESPIWKSTTSEHKKGEPKSHANPATMKKAMLTMHEKYGVRFWFCDKSRTGELIVKTLSKGGN